MFKFKAIEGDRVVVCGGDAYVIDSVIEDGNSYDCLCWAHKVGDEVVDYAEIGGAIYPRVNLYKIGWCLGEDEHATKDLFIPTSYDIWQEDEVKLDTIKEARFVEVD